MGDGETHPTGGHSASWKALLKLITYRVERTQINLAGAMPRAVQIERLSWALVVFAGCIIGRPTFGNSKNTTHLACFLGAHQNLEIVRTLRKLTGELLQSHLRHAAPR